MIGRYKNIMDMDIGEVLIELNADIAETNKRIDDGIYVCRKANEQLKILKQRKKELERIKNQITVDKLLNQLKLQPHD